MQHFIFPMLLAATLAANAQTEAPNQPDPSEGFMRQFDTDKNGRVTLVEFKAPQVSAIEQQFNYMDKNADGNVDRAEVDAFGQEMRQRMEQMQKQQQGGAYRQ